ncbi:MAG: T9SS type A sorting domain-containing protein [Ignavibacteriales bacterium]|nr:MAG: T9SS type A sorting domain-containing protein [Ignavibacteriales bacterium]
MKKVVLSIIMMTMISSFAFAQTVTVSTYGVSPYDVTVDSIEHYYDRAYNGLVNVGKETKVYLKAKSTAAFQTPVWSFLEKPAGSTAAFVVKDIDTSNQIVSFIVDLLGTYKVTFFSGTKGDTIVLNSALYLGVEGGLASCKTCHNNLNFDYVYDKWVGTQHAISTQKGVDGISSSHFGASCLKCHATGYDANAVNDGFDDFPFVFPSTLQTGNYEMLIAQYPEAMKRANVQCESCHGPGGNHYSQMDDAKIDVTIASAVCSYCHEDGNHHIAPIQWDVSVHAAGTHLYSGSSRYSCTPCHNGQGFVDYVKGKPQSVQVNIPITCATCHDPHDATNPSQLRKVTATLNNGFEFDGGAGSLCANCHKSRVNSIPYVEGFLSNLTRFGPHHSGQADIIAGTNAYTWGETLPTSPHMSGVENACVSCHMAEGEHSPGGNVPLSGGHSFSMTTPDGHDNVSACEPCHGSFGEEFGEKKFYINGNADLDRNGVAEGLQHEIHGLLEQVAMLLPPYGSTTPDPIDSTWTLDEAAALFNYLCVEEDRSFGIHNPQFTVSLLYLSIGKLGGTVDIDDLNFNTPTEYVLEQNYPNPFNPSTRINYSVPFDSKVKITVYNINGEVISELFKGSKAAGTYNVEFNTNGKNLASGVYFYSIEASGNGNQKSFRETRKMVLLK